MRFALACCILLTALTSAAPANAKPLELRVVSWNVWGLPYGVAGDRILRIHRIGPALAELRPDLVALQEVWVPEDGEQLKKALAEAGLIHVHHESDGFLGSGLLVASRYPITRTAFTPFRLSGKLHKPYHGDAFTRKGILLVHLDTPAGPLLFANTHLHARYGTDEYLPVQIDQAMQAAYVLGTHGAEPSPRREDPARPPLILAGDLNSRGDALPYRLLTKRAGLRPVTDDLKVDWILYRHGGVRRVRVKSVESHLFADPVELAGGSQARLSDHDAVLTVLELREGPPPEWTPKADQAAWIATRDEALPIVEAALLASEEADSRAARWTLLLLLLAAGFYGFGRWRRKKTQRRSCGAMLLNMIALHLAVWTAYMSTVYEATQQVGLKAAIGILKPEPKPKPAEPGPK